MTDDEPQFTSIPMKDLAFPEMLGVLMERKDRMYRKWASAFGMPADYLSPVFDWRQRELDKSKMQ